MAAKQVQSERQKTWGRLTETLSHQEDTARWCYRVLANGLIEGILRDSRHELRLQFDLDDIIGIRELNGNLLLTFRRPLTVQAENGEQSLDTSWPLVLDWTKYPELKAELIRHYHNDV